jgi:pSer/pThr/pTyr-binding forkhead associated (FHA) protein
VAANNTSKDTTNLAIGHDPSASAIETRFGRRDQIVIGRGVECDVVIKDAKASRKHCRLTRKTDGFMLEDLGSKNGTYVDGQKIAAQVSLRADQTFKIGDTVFYLSH